ncbi:MAG: hypothetical protein J6R59_01455 [Paludibacteraceae bacterium]|nr:hypothetical protein [Paludibacteraceae bacterium]
MYKYNVKIQKVSGSLNESSIPTKNLVVKSKTKKTDKQVFAEASKYYKEKYGLVIESADVTKNNYKMFEVGETYDGLFLDHWGYRNTNNLVFQVISRNEEYVVLKAVAGDFENYNFPKQSFKRKIRIDMRYKSFAQEYVQLPKAFWVNGEHGIVAVNNEMV